MSSFKKRSKTYKNVEKEKGINSTSAKKRFVRGTRYHIEKNYDLGRKAFIHSVQYNKRVWRRATPLYLTLLISATILFFIISIVGLDWYYTPFLVFLTLILVILAFILEIWLVGEKKKPNNFGQKIRRKAKNFED